MHICIWTSQEKRRRECHFVIYDKSLLDIDSDTITDLQ